MKAELLISLRAIIHIDDDIHFKISSEVAGTIIIQNDVQNITRKRLLSWLEYSLLNWLYYESPWQQCKTCLFYVDCIPLLESNR